MSGALHQYEVELAKENIIAIVQDFSKKATGKALTTESLKNLTENLSTLNLKGTLAFNGDDAHEAQFDGILTDTTGSGTSVNIALSEMKNGFSLSSGNKDGSLVVKVGKNAENSTNLSIIATEGGKELARIVSTLKRE